MINNYSEYTSLWKLDKLGKLVDEFDAVVAECVSKNNIKYGFDYTNIVLSMAGKCIVTLREIMCLSSFGYPDGALSLSRNIYEQFIILFFFESNKQQPEFQQFVDDYYCDYDIQRLKKLKLEYELRGETDCIENVEQDLEKTKKKAHNKVGKDYWWSGFSSFRLLKENVVNLATDIETKKLINLMHIAYLRACISIHASCLGNTVRLGMEKEFVGVDNTPKSHGHGLPLWLSTVSFALIVEATCNELQIKDDFRDKFVNISLFYLKKYKEDLNYA